MNLEDIAKKAGVSRSTVSRVINNEPHVSQQTRERVLAVIEQVGFSPNPGARMLVTQRTRMIGIVIPRSLGAVFGDPYYFPTLLQGISDATAKFEYATLLWTGSATEDEETFYQRVLKNRLMDGLVLASAVTNRAFTERLLTVGMPFVQVERPAHFADQISYVSIDNVQAAAEAVEHLIALGHRRIGMITGDLDNADGFERVAGYRQALERAGLPVDESLIVEGHWTRESGYQGGRALAAQNTDAIFAANDLTALGVLDALQDAGLSVPDDVALVGFDDLPTAQEARPLLTTIRQPIHDKAVRATELLLALIDGEAEGPRHVLLPTRLVIRESCGAGAVPE